MFGCVGRDQAGRELVENLVNCGVHTEAIEYMDETVTGQAMITVGGGDNSIVVIPGGNECVDIEYVKRHEEHILEADMLVLQNEIPEETVAYVIRLAYDNQKIIVWNPAPAKKAEEELIRKVTYITPNEHEAGIIWDTEKEEIPVLLKKYPEKLIVTQGEKGVAVCTKDGEVRLVPARKVNVVDTTGAGDTLNGAFCFGLSNNMDIMDALEFANAAAGLSIQKSGAQKGMPTLEDVKKVME